MSDNSSGMVYDKSPIPPAKAGAPPTERNPDRGIGVNEQGQLAYDSASASGHIPIEIPSLPGSPNATETLHARNFPEHIIGKMEAAFKKPNYLKSGAQQSPSQVFAHYCAVARGASLVDAATLKRMTEVSKEFSGEAEPEAYFREVLAPYLRSLSPERRQS